MPLVPINLRLGQEDVRAIDKARSSTTPRTHWIRTAIRERLAREGRTESADPEPSRAPGLKELAAASQRAREPQEGAEGYVSPFTGPGAKSSNLADLT